MFTIGTKPEPASPRGAKSNTPAFAPQLPGNLRGTNCVESKMMRLLFGTSSLPATRAGRAAIVMSVAAAAALLLLVSLRFVRYLPLELPEPLDALLGLGLVVSSFSFLYPMLGAPVHALALLAVAVLAALAPRRVLASAARPWHLAPWLHALVWVELLLNHYLLDLNPYLALLLVVGWLAVEVDRIGWLGAPGHRGLAAAAALAALALGVGADTPADMAASVVFAPGVWWLLRAGPSWFGVSERRLLVVVLGIGCQLLAAALPLLVPMHGGTRLGEGLAYSFCEAPTRPSLFAAIPQAPTMRQWSLGSAHGMGGYVAEYDADTLVERARHRFFSATFHGRLEYLLCLDDSVQVGMTNATIDGRRDQDNAMAFSLDEPRRFERDLLGGGVGHAVAYDRARDALFYVSENKPNVVRVERTSGRRELLDPLRTGRFALVVGPQSVHRARDRLYVTEWLNGHYAHELDLGSLAVTRSFAHRNGGAPGIAVDEELDRLYTVGIWGMEVFDLTTGTLIARKRLGFPSRSPAIDRANDLVYVPSTVEGKIRVFDRHSLEMLGAIAIGYGPRLPYLSPSRGRLYASTSRAHYYWTTTALAARFR